MEPGPAKVTMPEMVTTLIEDYFFIVAFKKELLKGVYYTAK